MTPQEEWQKKVRRILLDPDGRAALKAFGIDVEIADAKKPDAAKPIVVVLCPTYRAPDPQMQDALGAMVRYTREKDLATIYSGAPMSASVVHWSRNGLITEQLKSGKPWTHALFIDDDIVVQPDHLERLLSHKKDIVAGLCTRRQDPPIPNIRHFDETTGNFGQIWEWPKEQALIEVGAVGTGLMLLTQHAVEQVAQAYFDCLWEKEFYGISDARAEELKAQRLKLFDDNKTCYWFRFLPAFKQPIEYGEDVGFCMLAKRYCGLATFVDTTVLPGHIGNYAYSIRDFEPYREECVLRAKVQGSYPMEVPEMKISILCPTRGRPENVKRLIDSVVETATVPPEFVFYVDEDDKTFPGSVPYPEVKVIVGDRILMSKMWNRLAQAATGEILMMGGDDIVFKTKGWDDQVRRAFAAFPDRLIFVHGDDGVYGDKFGSHGFLHRNWMDVVGYFVPPYFASDFNDTWWNDVANALNRRVPLNFLTEHMHPLAGKAEWDKTHQERLARHKETNPEKMYAELEKERISDINKLAERIRDGQSSPTRQPQLVTV